MPLLLYLIYALDLMIRESTRLTVFKAFMNPCILSGQRYTERIWISGTVLFTIFFILREIFIFTTERQSGD